MTVKLIIADIDGCLTPEESIPWDLDRFWHFAKLARETAEGRGDLAPITLCTGRPQPYVEAMMKLLDIRIPAICENGAIVYSLHDNRAQWGPGVSEAKIVALRAIRSAIEREIMPAYPQLQIQFGKEAQISIFSKNTDIFGEIQPLVEEICARDGGLDVDINSSVCYMNLSFKGVDKGQGIRALLKSLGVKREETAGIGDTDGDLALRDAVGFFACPANATESIKAVADYISPHNELEGVLDILSRKEFRRPTAKSS